MHVYFSGIGGAGLSALALMAKEAGMEVSGSDKQDNHNLHYLKEKGINDIHVGQSWDQMSAVHDAKPIDWLVYTSALPMEQPDADELRFAREKGIKATKRDEFLSFLLEKQNLKMIAIAGTHGKTTTTAMTIWLFKQLNMPISYNLAGSISFGDSAELAEGSEYFVYEADEFDRNFLAFHPAYSIISGIDWDHPDIYPTREEYYQAFRDFLSQSDRAAMWDSDAERLSLPEADNQLVLDDEDIQIDEQLHLVGRVNRQNAWLVAQACSPNYRQTFGRVSRPPQQIPRPGASF
jgi:UDP-N-acetylmuramate--alanine ligase